MKGTIIIARFCTNISIHLLSWLVIDYLWAAHFSVGLTEWRLCPGWAVYRLVSCAEVLLTGLYQSTGVVGAALFVSV